MGLGSGHAALGETVRHAAQPRSHLICIHAFSSFSPLPSHEALSWNLVFHPHTYLSEEEEEEEGNAGLCIITVCWLFN